MTTAVLRAMTITAATLVAAIALFAPAAVRAGEYCSVDDASMRNCGFSSMEQCKAAVAGMNGDCTRDPFFKDNSIATINRNTYAYAPLSPRHARDGRSSAIRTNR